MFVFVQKTMSCDFQCKFCVQCAYKSCLMGSIKMSTKTVQVIVMSYRVIWYISSFSRLYSPKHFRHDLVVYRPLMVLIVCQCKATFIATCW